MRSIHLVHVESATTEHPYQGGTMRLLSHCLRRPRLEVTAHCDLPCGVYDPAQARIEAESVKAIQEKYQGNDDPSFRARAIEIKEQRSDLVKHHLWVLWTDYFKPPHFEEYPERHEGLQRPGHGPGPARPDRPDRQDLLGDQAGCLIQALNGAGRGDHSSW